MKTKRLILSAIEQMAKHAESAAIEEKRIQRIKQNSTNTYTGYESIYPYSFGHLISDIKGMLLSLELTEEQQSKLTEWVNQ